MSAPTLETRRIVYSRDAYKCVMCNRSDGLTFQHRRAVGQGGSKILPSPVDGLTLCAVCNAGCEGDLQAWALGNGWKVRRWADPARVPVYYQHEFTWYRLEGIRRVKISSAVAMELGCSIYGDEWAWMRAQELFIGGDGRWQKKSGPRTGL